MPGRGGGNRIARLFPIQERASPWELAATFVAWPTSGKQRYRGTMKGMKTNSCLPWPFRDAETAPVAVSGFEIETAFRPSLCIEGHREVE